MILLNVPEYGLNAPSLGINLQHIGSREVVPGCGNAPRFLQILFLSEKDILYWELSFG